MKKDTNEQLRIKISQACAKAYCSKKNEKKNLDADLLEAITDEIMSLPMKLDIKSSCRMGTSSRFQRRK